MQDEKDKSSHDKTRQDKKRHDKTRQGKRTNAIITKEEPFGKEQDKNKTTREQGQERDRDRNKTEVGGSGGPPLVAHIWTF